MAIKYLSGKRLQGTEAERIGLNSTPPPSTSWKILGRTAVTSGTDIDVTVTAKDNMMILQHLVPNGTIDQGLHFNDDGGSGGSSNYAWRVRRDGSATGQGTSTYRINTEELYPNTAFEVFNMQHTNGQEKLLQWNVAMATTTGAGTAPSRTEGVGKWANTGNVTKVSFTGISSVPYATGSEVVVIGCDNDESNSGTNAWQQLGKTTLTATADTITVDSLEAKKYLWVEINTLGVGAINNRLRFNNDSGSNYAWRVSGNGGSDSTSTGQTGVPFGNGNTVDPDNAFDNIHIINAETKEKLVIGHTITDEGTGAGNAPQRNEVVAKWANTSNAITRVDLVNTGSGDYASGSSITVWGFD